MSETNIPPRFNEASFRRYEPFITSAMLVLPSELDIHCREQLGLSPETVSCRLRDAMRSLHTYNWQTSVNMLKFAEYYSQLEVARKHTDAGIVVIRLKTSRAVEPTKQLSYIDIPIAGDAQQRETTVKSACALANIANETLGQCGLGGLRLAMSEDEFKRIAGDDATYVVDKGAIVLL